MDGVLISMYAQAVRNIIFELVMVAIVIDTIFGALRAIKEKKFNSNCGINGAIRKVAMIVCILALVIVDYIVDLNLIGFIPEAVRSYLPSDSIGTMEFFGILFIAYEVVSILKNMALCGLPVKKIWQLVKSALGKYTDELPDGDELEQEAAEAEPEEAAKTEENT